MIPPIARVAGYQGEPGAFSDDAARRLAPGALTQGFPTFDDVAAAVASGEIDYGVLPVENSISGPIPRVYDLLWLSDGLVVVDEIVYRVEQTLVGTPEASLETLREVRSHPVALEQCRSFLASHPSWLATIVADTAGAVREIVSAGDAAVGAIGSTLAAERYGARVLATNVQDRTDNFTRFFLVRRGDAVAPKRRERLAVVTGAASVAPATREPTRACLALLLANRPGSLRDALAAIADRGLDLRSLVSRPTEVAFTYRFYLEIATTSREALEDAIAAIDGAVRVMGFY